jgi:hypothetical protein
MIYVKILTGISVAVSGAWLIAKPGFDSCVAFLGTLTALITVLIVERKRRERPLQQQNVESHPSASRQVET